MVKKNKIEIEDFSSITDLMDGTHQVIPIVSGEDELPTEVDMPEVLPILTLRSSVLFPGSISPITVGREKSIKLVRDVEASKGLLGAVLQKEVEIEQPAPDDMYRIGTAARIIKILEMPNGNLTVILHGIEKIEIREYLSSEPYFTASVTALKDTAPDNGNVEFGALVDSIRDVALGIVNTSSSVPKEAAFAIKNIDSRRGLINFVCSNMDLSDADRQQLLEAPGLLARALANCSKYSSANSSFSNSKTRFRARSSRNSTVSSATTSCNSRCGRFRTSWAATAPTRKSRRCAKTPTKRTGTRMWPKCSKRSSPRWSV